MDTMIRMMLEAARLATKELVGDSPQDNEDRTEQTTAAITPELGEALRAVAEDVDLSEVQVASIALELGLLVLVIALLSLGLVEDA